MKWEHFSAHSISNYRTVSIGKPASRNSQLRRLVARATIYRNCCARIELLAIINGKARANHVVQCEFVENGGKCSMLGRGIERTAKLSVISKGEVRASCKWDGTIDDSGEAECNRARDEARSTKTQRDRNMTNARQQPRCGQSAHGHRSKLTFSYIHSPKFPVFSFRFIDTPRITKFGTRTIATQFTTRPRSCESCFDVVTFVPSGEKDWKSSLSRTTSILQFCQFNIYILLIVIHRLNKSMVCG